MVRTASANAHAAATERRAPRRAGDIGAVRTLLPYLWEYKGRVLAALAHLEHGGPSPASGGTAPQTGTNR